MATQLTRAQCVTKRDLWLSAEEAVSTGQSYEIGGRSLTRVDIRHIQAQIAYWARQIEEFDTAGQTDYTPTNHGFRVGDFR